MKIKYLAHPFEGKPENKEEVEKIIKALMAKEKDVVYISPIHCLGFLYDTMQYEDGMELCFELMNLCDELILCDGWQESKGCKLEWAYAAKHGIVTRYCHQTWEVTDAEM